MELRISSFEIRALVEELSREIEQAYFEKVQQIGPELFKFSFSTKSGKRHLLVEIGKRFNLTDYSLPAPSKPSQACIILRKHLENKRLSGIGQHGFDRVMVLDFTDKKLIFEFFSHGNMILIDDENKALLSFRSEEWKDRELKKGSLYQFPKGASNPITITLAEFRGIFTEKDAVRGLAKNLSIGGDYAEEICAIAGVDKNKEKLTENEKEALFRAMKELLGRPITPVMQDNRLFPFPISKFEVQKEYGTMNNAVDEFYLTAKEESAKLKKLRKRLEEQLKALDRFEQESEENRKKGDLIYTNYQLIENMLEEKKTNFSVDLD